MLLSVDGLVWPLPGRARVSSGPKATRVFGRSLELGRAGPPPRTSMSVDFDRRRDAFDRLGGWDSPSLGCFVVLLRVRHTEPTLESDSSLLFSRLGVPNPNFFRREEAFELREPVLIDRARLSESVAESDVVPADLVGAESMHMSALADQL